MTDANRGRRRKIGFIQPWDRAAPPNPGGSLGIWTWEVARRIADTCDVLVYGSQLNGPVVQEECEGVRFIRFPLVTDNRLFAIARRISDAITRRILDPRQPVFASPNYLHIYVRSAAQSLQLYGCEVIHIFNHSQFIPMMRRVNPQSKIVLNMQCDWLVQLDPAVINRDLRGVDVIAGCSNYVTDAIRTRFPHYADRCTTIYNGADMNVFSPREIRQGESGSERIIFVNRISPEKGLHVLLEAFEKIAARRPKAILEIIGPDAVMPLDAVISLSDNPVIRELSRFYPGSYRNELQRRLPSSLDRRVLFLGALHHQELAKRMRQSDVLVHPSVFDDPFPLTIVEAMASGLPIVASAVGGIPESVVDGQTGFLVERSNPAALADAVIRLLENPRLARSMGSAARARAEAKFSWDHIVEAWIDAISVSTSSQKRPCGQLVAN